MHAQLQLLIRGKSQCAKAVAAEWPATAASLSGPWI